MFDNVSNSFSRSTFVAPREVLYFAPFTPPESIRAAFRVEINRRRTFWLGGRFEDDSVESLNEFLARKRRNCFVDEISEALAVRAGVFAWPGMSALESTRKVERILAGAVRHYCGSCSGRCYDCPNRGDLFRFPTGESVCDLLGKIAEAAREKYSCSFSLREARREVAVLESKIERIKACELADLEEKLLNSRNYLAKEEKNMAKIDKLYGELVDQALVSDNVQNIVSAG